MIPVNLQTLAEICDGKLYGTDLTIEEVTTDTRDVAVGSLFIALIGERFDAHQFVGDAIANGALALLVSQHLNVAVPQVVVADTRIALGRLAAWVRQQSGARVVALTGSAGKTSVKEMTAAILRECGETLHTAGNLNNDIGAPLTLLRLNPQHQFAVIELGANHQGEIAYTSNLVRPQAALINNLAAAHLEGFGSLAGVAKAKGEIFSSLPTDGTAIINNESHDWENWQSLLPHQRVWRFSAESQIGCDFRATDIRQSGAGTAFILNTPRGSIDITLPLPGRHNIANALAAAALAMAVEAPLTAIQRALSSLSAVPGRLFPVPLAEQQQLLDDTYNANPGSMAAAIQVLSEMPGYRVLVTGDMAELGDASVTAHQQMGQLAKTLDIDEVLSVGLLSQHTSAASQKGQHFADKPALTAYLRTILAGHRAVTILVKGSRSAAMEQVVRSLQEKGTC